MTDPPSPRYAELVELLRHHVADDGERDALEAMRRLAHGPGDVLSSSHLRPGHFTASAFVTDAAFERLLLVHHRKLGIWLQPGGHIEPVDPTMAAAAAREVREETGIEARRYVGHPATIGGRPDPGGRPRTSGFPPMPVFDVDVHRIPRRGGDAAHLHYDVRFHLVGEERDPVISEEVLDVAWVDLGDVASLTTDASVARGVAKLLRMRRPPPGGRISGGRR